MTMKIKTLCGSLAAAALMSVASFSHAATTNSVFVGSIEDTESMSFSGGNVTGVATITVLSFAETAANGGSPFRAVFEFFAGGNSVNAITLDGPSQNQPVGQFNFNGEELGVTVTGETGASDFQVDVSVTSVPLPAAGLMLMGALGGIGMMRRRKTA